MLYLCCGENLRNYFGSKVGIACVLPSHFLDQQEMQILQGSPQTVPAARHLKSFIHSFRLTFRILTKRCTGFYPNLFSLDLAQYRRAQIQPGQTSCIDITTQTQTAPRQSRLNSTTRVTPSCVSSCIDLADRDSRNSC